MITNTSKQNIFNANAIGNSQATSPYALLTRMAELDVEFAKQATAVGMAVELLFPDDSMAFVIANPHVSAQKANPKS